MQRGPKPMPRNLRLVRGDKSRLNPDEPIVEVAAPDAPDYLTERERQVFTENAVKLARMRVMTEVDIDALAVYAVNFVRWREACKMVEDTGYIMQAPSGYPVPNPVLAIANKAQAEFMRIATEFGMTPSSRTRVKAE